MDYVEGFTLGGWMERTRATAHELVVVMDLKPGNILVRAGSPTLVVVDYGVAHFPLASGPPLTDTRLPPGTRSFTTPEAELYDVQHRHDPAARYEFKVTDELYALGVTLS